jgi:ABC-type molybdate transport system substrate-binding protein
LAVRVAAFPPQRYAAIGRRGATAGGVVLALAPAAIVAGKDSAEARSFLRFLESPEANATFRKYGFSIR